MPSIVEKLENDLKALSSRDKAALAHFLIEELDGQDQGVEEIWRKEAETRYKAYKTGKLTATSGKETMMRARKSLK